MRSTMAPPTAPASARKPTVSPRGCRQKGGRTRITNVASARLQMPFPSEPFTRTVKVPGGRGGMMAPCCSPSGIQSLLKPST